LEEEDEQPASEAENIPPARNKGGRPKGSTNEAKADSLKWKKITLNDAAVKMKRLKDEAAAVGKRAPQNAYKVILLGTSEKYDLLDVLDNKSVESRLRHSCQ
jgi:hypothetical protein